MKLTLFGGVCIGVPLFMEVSLGGLHNVGVMHREYRDGVRFVGFFRVGILPGSRV